MAKSRTVDYCPFGPIMALGSDSFRSFWNHFVLSSFVIEYFVCKESQVTIPRNNSNFSIFFNLLYLLYGLFNNQWRLAII